MDKQDILRLCRDCAASIYGTAPPSPQYAERVAKLLFMTAAHESLAFRFRRVRSRGLSALRWLR